MNSPTIRICERAAILLSLLAVGVALALGQPPAFALGIAAGAALAMANFVLIRLLVSRLVQRMQASVDGRKPRGLLVAALLFKIPAALAAVWLAINVLHLDAIGFGLGLTSVVGVFILGPFFISLRGDAERFQTAQPAAVRAGEPQTVTNTEGS